LNVLNGKVAIVTGASKGIGAAIAKHLARAGASVVINFASDEDGAKRAAAEITADGGKSIIARANVGIRTDVERLFKETIQAFGHLDILVNNAGVYSFGPLETVSEDEFQRQFQTNVLGALLTSQEAIKHFPSTGASIINIGTAGIHLDDVHIRAVFLVPLNHYATGH